MLPFLVVGGAYFAWCLVKEQRARRSARRIFEKTPNQPEVEVVDAEFEDKKNDSN